MNELYKGDCIFLGSEEDGYSFILLLDGIYQGTSYPSMAAAKEAATQKAIEVLESRGLNAVIANED